MIWEKKKLKSIAEISAGGTPSRSNEKYWKNGNIPWVKIKDINGMYVNSCDEFITEEGLKNSSAKIFKKGTILYTIFATLGEVAILNIDAATNQAIAGISVTSEEVDNRYLYAFLKSLKDRINSQGRGVAQNNINLSILREQEIPLPPLETQKKIADVLDKAQELIDKRKEQIEKLDEFVQSVFLDMFGDPVNNERLWKQKTIASFTEVETGATPNRSNNFYYKDGNIPWIKTSEINGKYILNSEEFITQKAIEETNCKVFPRDTILIAMYGQGQTRGRVGLMKIEGATNQACAAILPQRKVNVQFLYYQLLLRYEELRSLGRGGNQPNLNLSMIKNLKVILPPLNLQNKFAQIAEKAEYQKVSMQQSLTEMENLFNSLMKRAFQGDLF